MIPVFVRKILMVKALLFTSASVTSERGFLSSFVQPRTAAALCSGTALMAKISGLQVVLLLIPELIPSFLTPELNSATLCTTGLRNQTASP